jgi:hypothetical protein
MLTMPLLVRGLSRLRRIYLLLLVVVGFKFDTMSDLLLKVVFVRRLLMALARLRASGLP